MKATAGKFYNVVNGDRIRRISVQAYGEDKSADIVKANQELLKNRQTSLESLPIIIQGDKLWIPPIEPIEQPEPETIQAESEDEIAIRIDGKIFRGWTTTSINRAINSIADSFSFNAPYNPDDKDSEFLDPYTYFPCDLFIGGKPYIIGRAEKWNPTFADKTFMGIEARSLPAILIDCPSTDGKLNYVKNTLKEIAEILIKPFGIRIDTPYGDSDIFNNTKRNLSDKVASFLQGLSKKKGFVLNSTQDGALKFDKANIDGKPIMSLVQGQQPLVGLSGSYDGTQRFSDYIATSQSKGRPGNSAISEDITIPIYRPIYFSAKDTMQGNIQTVADWQRSRALARSAPITATVGTWRDENHELIKENEIITLFAPKICVFRETRFLIEKVTLTGTDSQNKQAALTLVLPQAYTTDFPDDLPWDRD